MAKKTKDTQMQLIDVGPKNAKEIRPHLATYKNAVEEYSTLGNIVNTEKQAIIDLVHKADLQRLPNGNIEFTIDGVLIKIIPTEEKIKIMKPKAPKNVDPD
uniref:Uncharacterized protein n=1 Tax=viral metagenome TaxID=1070528 RepID=A0A6M3LHK6_9ZZZZ